MKTKALTLILAVSMTALLALTGCVSIGKDYAKFIQEMPGIEANGVSAETLTPLYSHKESASGISTDPDTGVLTIVDGVAQVTIPLWGSSKTVRITGLKVQATPAQLAAARAIKAAKTAAPEPGKAP